MLMDEYHDGIPFDLMNKMVWSKAVNDTVGLNSFYSSLVNSNPSDNFLPRKSYGKSTWDMMRKYIKIKQVNRGFDEYSFQI